MFIKWALGDNKHNHPVHIPTSRKGHNKIPATIIVPKINDIKKVIFAPMNKFRLHFHYFHQANHNMATKKWQARAPPKCRPTAENFFGTKT
jgi:hypothetical protein